MENLTKEQIIEFVKKVKEIALEKININGLNFDSRYYLEFDSVSFDESGDIVANLSGKDYGDYIERSVDISLDELSQDIESIKAKRIADEKEKIRLKEIKDAEEREKKKIDIENKEKETLRKLKEKYER